MTSFIIVYFLKIICLTCSVKVDLHADISMIQRFKNRQKGVKRSEYIRDPVAIFLCVESNFLELINCAVLAVLYLLFP
jgi:hypothetical protein